MQEVQHWFVEVLVKYKISRKEIISAKLNKKMRFVNIFVVVAVILALCFGPIEARGGGGGKSGGRKGEMIKAGVSPDNKSYLTNRFS